MDKRIFDLVSNKLIIKKNEVEIELEKLINNQYNFSVEETTERIQENVTKLSIILHTIQMWENILTQVTPQQKSENPEEGNNK